MSAKPSPSRFVVEMQFGSEWQKETQIGAFNAMMVAMQMHMQRCHKGNKLTVLPKPLPMRYP